MISNRQRNRRSRGGSRNNNPGHNNRSRGNASQLLDKYKGLARDAQMSGDRVQAEYYLQFADHYFRVLEEHNSGPNDQQQQNQQQQRGSKGGKDNDGGSDHQQPKGDDKPKQSRKKVEPKDGDKPQRSRARKSDNQDHGEAIADALPPSIGGEDDKPKRSRSRKPSADSSDSEAA